MMWGFKLKLFAITNKNENSIRNEATESGHPKADVGDALKQDLVASKNIVGVSIIDPKGGENAAEGADLGDMNASGAVKMESSVTSDDVIRAGGFGARDDISSFLPVASDSTDFEATLRDARSYEEPQGEICRPGLGWRDDRETE
ncbi:hypothetical protein L1049_008414 [Liquidambar formosana]|uniref:Uncharacterized protein n=1 Tax=Liquidambar formosana TaxID=63359 RepID=A0AAP0S474_LIQFO